MLLLVHKRRLHEGFRYSQWQTQAMPPPLRAPGLKPRYSAPKRTEAMSARNAYSIFHFADMMDSVEQWERSEQRINHDIQHQLPMSKYIEKRQHTIQVACFFHVTIGHRPVDISACSEGVTGVPVLLWSPYLRLRLPIGAVTLLLNLEYEITLFETIGTHCQPVRALKIDTAAPAILDDMSIGSWFECGGRCRTTGGTASCIS